VIDASAVAPGFSPAHLRLAVLSPGLPAARQKRGGIERVAHVLAHGLADRGHHVVVFSHDEKPAGASYEVRLLPWKAFVNTWLGRRLTFGYLGNVLALLPDLREFDAVIAHGDSLLLPLKRKPVVRVMHGSALLEAAHASSLGRAVLQFGVYVQELLTAFVERGTVAVSENTRRHNPFVHHVIPNGVDTRIFRPTPGAKSASPSILFVGAVDGRKQGKFLLDVFSSVIRAAHPRTELMFVGASGPELPGVTYHTGIDDLELARLYNRAWVYASPSSYEGFGLPYLEALACGTAVVAVLNPGSSEVLADGRYGRIVDRDAFGRTIVELLNDAAARQSLEAEGMERARQFSSEIMIERYEALLRRLIQADARSVVTA
jgi:glycosyltransferase involved in cell wall biosynthesis